MGGISLKVDDCFNLPVAGAVWDGADPIVDYKHAPGCSVTGGLRYRGQTNAGLRRCLLLRRLLLRGASGRLRVTASSGL